MSQENVFTSPFESEKTLQHLRENPDLQKLDMSLIEMGDVDGKQIGEAVASQKHLTMLIVMLDSELNEERKSSPTSMWPMDSFLTAAFLKPDWKSSVRTLVIAGSGTDGDMMRLGVLPDVLRDNKTIKELEFRWHGDDGCTREEMLEILDVIRNAPIESLVLPNLVRWDFPNSDDDGFIDADSFALVVELVEHNTSLHKLELHIGECKGDRKSGDVVQLDAFYRALSTNSSIRSLYLKGPFYTPIAEAEFSNWIKSTTGLQELQLQGDADESPVPKLLFQALRDNKSLKKLELEDYFIEDEDADELLASLQVNATLQEIVFNTGFDREEEVREALKKNLDQ